MTVVSTIYCSILEENGEQLDQKNSNSKKN